MTENQQPYYTITGVEDTSVYTPQHGAVHAKRVRVRFSDGQPSFVDIPASEYNPQTVLDRVHALAVTHEQVMSIAGPPASQPLPEHPIPIDQLLGR